MVSWEETVLISVTVVFFGGVWLWRRTRGDLFELVGHVKTLVVYPVKSCAGILLDEAECTDLGIKYDRSWVIVRPDLSFVCQRKEPTLALVKPYFQDGFLWISAPGMPNDIKLDPNLDHGNKVSIDVCGISGDGVSAGEEAAQWISDYLNKPDFHIYVMSHSSKPRHLSKQKQFQKFAKTSDKSGFSDLTPYMVLSEASVDDLNTRVKKPKKVTSFRPNIVVRGSEAFAEDSWKKLRIGEVHFRSIMGCPRCVLTAVDQDTGTVDKTYEALKTLRSYRLHSDRGTFGDSPIFGFYFGIEQTGVIRVGDPIYACK